MNKKSRLLLPTIGLVVLSGIAATSTTFAWFTTVRSATVTMERAKVVSTDANLEIAPAHSWNSASALSGALTSGEGTTADVLKYTSGANGGLITDISGDGKNFYKPIWSSVAGIASSIRDVTPKLANGSEPAVPADGYLIDFTIKISRSTATGAEGLKVYLGAGTKFEAAGSNATKDAKAIAGARMSVYTSTAAGEVGTKIFVHSPVAETVNANKYLAAETSDDGAYGTTTHVVKDNLDVKSDAFITAGTNAAAKLPYPELAYLAGSEVGDDGTEVTNAFINFRFWVEGEDSDTTNSMIEGEFKVTLDLYALPWNA